MNKEEIGKLCASLSLIDREEPVHKLQDELKAAGAQKLALCLAGKILSPDLINRDAFRTLISKIWKVRGEVEIEEPAGKWAIKSLSVNQAEFWVQISNLPMLCMTKDIGRFLGSIIGDVHEVDLGPTSDCLGKFLRVRVAIRIDEPLRRFLRVDVLGDREETVMPIQYERLPDFCFHCGLLGHTIRGCPEDENEALPEGQVPSYGACLRATS
ncbi:hypothetical protein Dsin_011992 [Dipteronia sinensis]|uniref:CCHC-type domain-containing protein n=1 Tax=Dipteronia sinensis TaxID=43782 RepID=A0AAE0AIJ1_9ROSI|nr:hypothetical protein Dsin_011992 [Dipteronia sinensis]